MVSASGSSGMVGGYPSKESKVLPRGRGATPWGAFRGATGRGRERRAPGGVQDPVPPLLRNPLIPGFSGNGPSMLGSSAFEYAVRSLVYLARRDEPLVKLREISEAEAIPAPFLSNVLNRLVATGLLRSSRGPTGGYALAVEPASLRLIDIREAVDGLGDLDRCAVGLPQCSAAEPCAVHHHWVPVRSRIHAFLCRTTIGELASRPAGEALSEGEAGEGKGPGIAPGRVEPAGVG
jgi:Rrf2 family transcriptional regulator, iron-sulfur cluster assembly transcription factor